jgi:uncharacterized protein YceK
MKRLLVVLVLLALLSGCSSESKPSVGATAKCYTNTDTSGNLTATTESGDVTVTSSVDLTTAEVHVDMLDSSGTVLGYFTGEVAGITAGQPKTVKMNVGPENASVAGGVPDGGWETVTSCQATVTSYQQA